jgi:pyridoxamine 5'-phosphate oxidase
MNDTKENQTTERLRSGESDELSAASEPFVLFDAWLEEARRSEPEDPTAMALATVDADGLPNVRMVLLKGADPSGFVFYTNTGSQKGTELIAAGKAAVVFHWKSLRRQVRVRGGVTQVLDEEADAYFATRPRLSQIGAWASQQSRPLEARFELEAAVAKATARFAIGAVPRPPYWTGFRIAPVYIEFWRDRPFRLHDRMIFRRAETGGAWTKTRFYP